MNPPGNALRWRWLLSEVAAVGVPAVIVLLAAQGKTGFPLVSALAACAVLAVRARWPRVITALCMPALAGGLGWAPLVVAAFALGRTYPKLSRTVPWILLAAASAVIPVLIRESLAAGQIVLTVTFSLLVSGVPVMLGTLVRTRRDLADSLHELQTARSAELQAKAETARAEERARIAREIHDAVGHHATMIAVEAAALRATSAEAETRDSATRMRDLAKKALGEMRTTLGLDAGDPRQPTGLRDIPDLIAKVQASGVDVHLSDEIATGREVTSAAGRAAYRVVQEALTNASKHAPGAPVTVRLAEQDSRLEITVINGRALGARVDVGPGGSGLEGLSERVRMAGGQLRANPAADGGFELTAVLPR